MISSIKRRAGQLFLLPLLFVFQIHLQAQFSGAPSSGSAFSIPQAQLMQPEELNALLRARGSQKPIVLQVGSRVLFAQAHIPGAEFCVGCGNGTSIVLDEVQMEGKRRTSAAEFLRGFQIRTGERLGS